MYGFSVRCFKNTTTTQEVLDEEENTTRVNNENVDADEDTIISFDDEESLSGISLTGVKLEVVTNTTVTPVDVGVDSSEKILWKVELKFKKTDNSEINKTAKFSKAIKVKIPVTTSTKGWIKVYIKHGTNPFGFTWLATSPIDCNEDGTPKGNLYKGQLLKALNNWFVEIYTCSASTLAVTDEVAIAGIWNEWYETLSKAIAAVPMDGTQTEIVLLKNATINETLAINGNKNILLNLSWNTLINSWFTYVLNWSLEVKDGKFWNGINVYWYENSNYTSSLKIDDDVTLEWDYPVILHEYHGGDKAYWATIDVYWNINATNSALWVMWNIKQGNSVINIYGSLTGKNVWIAQNGYATVNVHTWATIYAQTETAFEQRAWITNIYGWTLKSDWTPASEEANNNWTTTVWAAFAVSPYNLSNQTINIEWWTFEAINALIITNETSAASVLQDRVTIGVEWWTFKGNVVSKNPVEWGDPIENFIEWWTFSKRPATEYCGDGLIPARNPNGTYWVKLWWKVTFKDGNETYVWPVVDWERISAATVTPEEWYVFDGWYESGATTSFNFNSLITRDINLESVWKVNVTFNSNWWSSVPTQTIKQGWTVTEPQNPEKAWYNFINWTKDDVAYGFNSPVSEPITLDANWNAISWGTAYTVIHQTRNENSPTYTQRDTVQEYWDAWTAVNPENIYKPNYEWYVFDRCDSVNIAWESTTVVRCYYELLNHNVEFYDDGNNEYAYDGSYKTVPNYWKIKKPEDPTKENDVEHTYSFVGWYETGATTAYDFDTIQTWANSGDVKTIKLYAKFDSLNKYTVSFYDEDGTTSLATTTVDSWEIAIYPNANPTKENTAETGYIFTGWYLSGDTNKTKVNLSSTVVLWNTEYIALYD